MKTSLRVAVIAAGRNGVVRRLRKLLISFGYSVLYYRLKHDMDGRAVGKLAGVAILVESRDIKMSERAYDELLDHQVRIAIVTEFDHIREPRHECLHTLAGQLSAGRLRTVMKELEEP